MPGAAVTRGCRAGGATRALRRSPHTAPRLCAVSLPAVHVLGSQSGAGAAAGCAASWQQSWHLPGAGRAPRSPAGPRVADAAGPGCVSAASPPPSASLPSPHPGGSCTDRPQPQAPPPTRTCCTKIPVSRPHAGSWSLLCPQHPLQPQGTPSLPRPDPRGWGRALRGAGVLAARNKAIFLSVPGCSGPVSALSRVRSQSWARAALGQPLAPSPSSEQQQPPAQARSPRPALGSGAARWG